MFTVPIMTSHSKAPTQKDLARRLGVSQSLVSRVLTGKADRLGASPTTVKRIRRIAKAAGYRPSPLAAALRGGSTRSFGVVVKDFRDPFFGHVLGELQSLASRHHYALLLTGKEPDDLAALRKYSPDGLIILGSDFEPDGLEAFLNDGKRAVRVGWGKPREGMDRVVMDEVCGLNLLLDCLTGQGHRRFGFLGTDSSLHQRRDGLLRHLLKDRGFETESVFLCIPRPSAEAGREGLKRLWSLPSFTRPTAILAADDLVAHGVLRAAASQGISIPRSLSVTGIDDLPFSELTVPALTTIRQPIRRMIQSVFSCLLKTGTRSPEEIRVKPGFRLRESTGPASRLTLNKEKNEKNKYVAECSG